MTGPNPGFPIPTDALRGALRPLTLPPRPIPCPETSAATMIAGRR
jgi:hypothetical protein